MLPGERVGAVGARVELGFGAQPARRGCVT